MKTRLLAMLVVCLTTCFTAAQSFTVGTATATLGQRAFGAIEVPAGRDAAASIPVAVFRGAKPGPVLALVSGSHGTEYASIIALEKLIQSLDPAQISGTVIILPLVNVPSFEQPVFMLVPGLRHAFYPRRSTSFNAKTHIELSSDMAISQQQYIPLLRKHFSLRLTTPHN